jgi:hypothetical protein
MEVFSSKCDSTANQTLLDSQRIMECFREFFICKRCNRIKDLFWLDIEFNDTLTRKSIYGRPYVLDFLEDFIVGVMSRRILKLELGVLPKNLPAWYVVYQNKKLELWIFKIVEDKVIGIERTHRMPNSLILTT